MTHYLFEDDVFAQPPVYLSDKKTPALASHIADSMAEGAGLGRKFAGKVTADNLQDKLLADKNGVTSLGKEFCAAMGVAANHASLVLYSRTPTGQRTEYHPEYVL